eukprot:scaffold8371_cov199-Amphora_coffeaeformis.AAC.11
MATGEILGSMCLMSSSLFSPFVWPREKKSALFVSRHFCWARRNIDADMTHYLGLTSRDRPPLRFSKIYYTMKILQDSYLASRNRLTRQTVDVASHRDDVLLLMHGETVKRNGIAGGARKVRKREDSKV